MITSGGGEGSIRGQLSFEIIMIDWNQTVSKL